MILTGVTRADVITLFPVKDNSLFEDATGSLSDGAGGSLFAGRTAATGGNALRRGLVEFNFAGQIPAGATVTAAQLTMTVNILGPSAAPSTVTLQRVLADWGEGTSVAGGAGGTGAPSTPGDATWLHRFFPGTFWTTAGGDFNSTVSASSQVTGTGPLSWSSAGLVADVQGWLNSPGTNFGWIIRGDESLPGTGISFGSREALTVANRPALTVTFSPVPEPSTLALAGAAGLGFALRRKRHGVLRQQPGVKSAHAVPSSAIRGSATT